MFNPYCTKASRIPALHTPGLITAQHLGAAEHHGILLTFGYQLDGGNRKSLPVDAATARYIAERNPGGAVIVWQDRGCTLAHVYGRAVREMPE